MKTNQLIQQCKANNYSAQLKAYHDYKHMMYGAAVRIVKNREEAEDIVQDCFIKAFEKIHQLDDDANLGSWLKRIVINKSLDEVRKKNKIKWSDSLTVVEDTIMDDEEEVREEKVSVDLIKKCIESLKEKYRIILNLYLIEDYNHREISELLQIKESTVRNQYKRGKEQLLQLIQQKST